MNKNDINRFKDSDLREAIRRKYANTPHEPSDFNENIMKRIEIIHQYRTKNMNKKSIITALLALALCC